MRYRFAAAITLMLLSGCTSLDVLNAISKSPQAVPVTLRYGPSERQMLDLYLPRTALQAHGSNGSVEPLSGSPSSHPQPQAPIIVFFYGGAWASGSRHDYGFLARTFNDLGYLVAIPDYRLTPEVTYPGFLEDSAQAFRALIDHAERHGGDSQRIVLAGHSAGAYNAIMLATDRRWLSRTERERIRGVIGLSSPVNFLPIQMPEARIAFNWPYTPRDTQPVEHVTAETPPMLLLSPRHDPLVDPSINSAVMAQRLESAGVYVKLELYDGPLGIVGHSNIVASLSSRLSFLAPTIARSREFLERVAGSVR